MKKLTPQQPPMEDELIFEFLAEKWGERITRLDKTALAV